MKRLENLGWPSYWTQYAKSAFDFVQKNMIPIYTFFEDAVLSLRNEENSLENISYLQAN